METLSTSAQKQPAHKCRMCSSDAVLFHTDKTREYYQCLTCQLVFVPLEYAISEEEEKAVYDLHENVSGDAGYERFLSRAANPVIEYFSEGNVGHNDDKVRRGLDFGCGPCTVLANMLSASPHYFHVDSYDLFYFPQNARFLERIGYYDFITATEVVEHLADPLAVLRTLWSCLQSNGGILVIMTKRVDGTIERFRNWHYIRDPTHISFFHEHTFAWLSNALPACNETCEVKVVGPDVVILLKKKNQ
ncbi:hypothetical protein ABB37_08210 [Leptomonas pyrrhocoris]|uniref:Uncharacterized protein n=1 Tax=Leptomonas pyrrhocoris TaxID=157538 RepID=A0A0N0DSK8_LEPPY|nr:hypothetical protein ABB37_08210 [Leptomonas pyrrhocoris]KPA76084.1 hypothetical protein ABB37_08210 [Leptomonas pyrrhocoris]|eukprot:XP_015654523.1 hypothetical protein ABB37_08210 [Leptomonas pyrrhocoris]